MSAGPQATVRLSSIEANAKTIQGLLGTDCVPAWVVKDDAYGLGAREIAARLGKGRERWYAVAFPEEGAALREAGVESRILVLQPPARGEGPLFREYDLVATVWGEESLEHLKVPGKSTPGSKTALHVEVDTGMNRGGVAEEDLLDLVEEIDRRAVFGLDGLYSHLANVRDADYCAHQRRRFERCLNALRATGRSPSRIHLCSSGGIRLGPEYHFNMVRPGLALYGVWPVETRGGPPLREALTLSAPLLKVRAVAAGEWVGYDGAFRADRPMRVGVIAAGYAHGLPRGFPQRGAVLVRGDRAPCLGVACMDMTLVDLSEIKDASEGDEAVLLGRQGEDEITLGQMAEWMDCIPYEALCRLGGLCPRRFVD